MLSLFLIFPEMEDKVDMIKSKEDGLSPSKTVDFRGRKIIDMIFAEGKEYAHG